MVVSLVLRDAGWECWWVRGFHAGHRHGEMKKMDSTFAETLGKVLEVKRITLF